MAASESSAESKTDSQFPILHVIVVDFHHKKGCQVEYSYPPLVPASSDPTECPPEWKYLPSLALPDGSHLYKHDTVYFHLPSLTNPKETVYGISCYRQIPLEKVKYRTPDMTRETVQKSVCVISALPLFGHIQVKMELITHAYFEEGDFSKVTLLQDTYNHLNSCLGQLEDLRTAPRLFVGLSTRDLILQFRHKVLLLFKLSLLEKRVVFYRSPVQPLCASILALLSLHPGMIEKGLTESACVTNCEVLQGDSKNKEQGDTVVEQVNKPTQVEVSAEVDHDTDKEACSTDSGLYSSNGECNNSCVADSNSSQSSAGGDSDKQEASNKWLEISPKEEADAAAGQNAPVALESSLPRDISSQDLASWQQNNLATIAQINAEDCGTPLPIFTKGYLCLPYLSLPYLDLLSDANVRGYMVGATNVLFKQKRQLADVLVEVESAILEAQDPVLRRQLHLTTEDLRFADFLVRHVAGERHDVFLDGVGWEGGDEWIRTQFRVYMLCLLRTSLLQDGSREIEQFNSSFMAAWRGTQNYQAWLAGSHDGIWEVNPGHPFAGQLSVADMKLRISHTMQNTEGGRKVTQAMVSTGRAVGGAITQAKGALSNWWSNLTTNPVAEGVAPGATAASAPSATATSEESSPTAGQNAHDS